MDGHGISLSRIIWNKALLHPCVPYYSLRAMELHFVILKCPKSVKISPSSQVLPCLFWGRCQIPRLGVSCSSGTAFRAWVFLLPFLGAIPNPSLGCVSCLGVSCSSGAAFRVGVLFWPFLGAMPNPSLGGCFLLVGCLLNGWSWDQSI